MGKVKVGQVVYRFNRCYELTKRGLIDGCSLGKMRIDEAIDRRRREEGKEGEREGKKRKGKGEGE